MSKQRMEYRIGVGAPVILMILVVVALAVLSLLSWIGARNDAGYSSRSIQMTAAYYQAAEQAQMNLMALDEQLLAAWRDSEDAAAYDEYLCALGMDAQRILRWTEDAGDERSLVVEIRLTPYEQVENSRYEITGHWLRDDSQWENEQELNLIGS